MSKDDESSLLAVEKPSDEPVLDTQHEEKKKYFEKLDADARKRLDYLLDQAEIYTHFLPNGVTSKSNDEQRSKNG